MRQLKYFATMVKFLFHCSVVFQNWTTTILVVSHDRSFLNSVSTDILHLHNKQLTVYKGNYENFHRTREERLKNQQKEYDAQKQYRDHIQVNTDPLAPHPEKTCFRPRSDEQSFLYQSCKLYNLL